MSFFSSKVGHLDDASHELSITESNSPEPTIDYSQNAHGSRVGSPILQYEEMEMNDSNLEIDENFTTEETASKSESEEARIIDEMLEQFINSRKNFLQNQTYFDSESSEEEEEGSFLSIKYEGEVQDYPSVRFTVSKCKTFAGMNIEDRFEGVKVKIGQRVVRGKDWKYDDADGGEGNIGTVMFVNHEKEMVIVQWDSQEKRSNYRIGKDKKFDLRLFDNAQTGAKHRNYTCDECYTSPIYGMKWKCRQCENFDLCSDCYMSNEDDLSHVFERKLEEDSISVELGPRKYLQPVEARGILPCADVKLRDYTTKEETGTAWSYIGKKFTLYQCDVLVTTENGEPPRRYRLGREGKVDIKYTSSENNDSSSYYEEHLPNMTSRLAKEGMRVVYTSSNNGEGILGTIINVKKRSKSEDTKTTDNTLEMGIEVQLDDGSVIAPPIHEIKLYDNSQIGNEHSAYCDVCGSQTRLITGIRWKCTICHGFDLCTPCYMNDEHNIDHKFKRIVDKNKRDTLETSREDIVQRKKKLLGIFLHSEVTTIGDVGIRGKVKKICNYRIDIERNACEVSWDLSDSEEYQDIIDLICISNNDCEERYYREHLPDLGNDTRGYVKVKEENYEALISLWFNKEKSCHRNPERPRLYAIFADNPKTNENDSLRRHLREIKKFAKKRRTPCVSVSQKLLFIEDNIFIHYRTEAAVIKLLISMGFSTIHRGEANEKEDTIIYFQRMAEYYCEDLLLPVIISTENGKSCEEVLKYASEKKTPIVYFRNDGHSAFVLTPDEEFHQSCRATEHRFDLRTPWQRQKVQRRVIETNANDADKNDELQFIDAVKLKQNYPFDALICFLLIGVAMESESEAEIFGSLTDVYPNAMSMYLLKEGQWKIPKNVIKKSFSHKSIEYIYGESMSKQFEDGLWKELQLFSTDAYQPPAWMETENDQRLDVTTSGLYGLIFYALLFRKFYLGAKQLVETGCVRIRHILVGCVILQQEKNNWQTSQLEQEQIQLLHRTFSHHALRIMSCIHDADNRNNLKKNRDDGRFVEYLLGDPIIHSGRLLLNHGYLKDAIKTENNTFLENEVVKDVLNGMWYGKDRLTISRAIMFLCLSLFHFVLLPILMITMENKPFQKLYKLYNTPFMKVANNLVGLFCLLVGYAYMLLCSHEENISYADLFLIVLMGSFLIDETKQIFIAIWRKKFKEYIKSPWNILDWLSMTMFACGMLLKFGNGLNYYNASKILLVLAFIFLSIRVFNLFCISELLGPKLVIIQKMFIDTFSFMAIMTVITMCYNVSYYAILYYGNSDFSFDTLEKVTRNGYWMLFGELNLDGDRLTEPECSFEKAIYSNGTLERCPSSLGRFLAPYLKALYGLVAVILMLNLLIAMYSNTFSEVHVKSKFYWSQLQTDFLEEYSIKSIFPFHMQWIAIVFFIFHLGFWGLKHGFVKLRERKAMDDDESIMNISLLDRAYKEEAAGKLNSSPMFVRVFLFNTNFDIRLRKTRKVEGYAALQARREMDIAEEDKITVLRKEIKTMKRNIMENNQKLMDELKKISQKLAQQEESPKRRSRLSSSRQSKSSTSSSSEDSDKEDLKIKT